MDNKHSKKGDFNIGCFVICLILALGSFMWMLDNRLSNINETLQEMRDRTGITAEEKEWHNAVNKQILMLHNRIDELEKKND